MKLMEEKFPPVDIMLYAHDGRGLGHISRSVAIGLAVRRLYPELRLLLLTGGPQTQELIGSGLLDWVKLPAYQTEVVNGKSRGIDGKSSYSDRQLGVIRGEQIHQIVTLYRPRVILADHSPQGKHRELLLSLQDPELNSHTTWLLGMRGVVGSVEQTSSGLAVDLYRKYYSGLLWYGDSGILGPDHCQSLNSQFSTTAKECGYVSRYTEIHRSGDQQTGQRSRFCSVISVPWAGEQTDRFLDVLASFLERYGANYGKFMLFVGNDISSKMKGRFERTACCTVNLFGSMYLETLKHSRTAVVFGGYNSVVDVLAAGIPALVVMRNMQDQEQQVHLSALAGRLPERFLSIEEHDCVKAPSLLHARLSTLFAAKERRFKTHGVNFSGAETAAHTLASFVGVSSSQV